MIFQRIVWFISFIRNEWDNVLLQVYLKLREKYEKCLAVQINYNFSDLWDCEIVQKIDRGCKYSSIHNRCCQQKFCIESSALADKNLYVYSSLAYGKWDGAKIRSGGYKNGHIETLC